MSATSIYKSPAGEKELMALYDAALARWPVAHETLSLPTRHGETFLIASGERSAPPLILLHGAAPKDSIAKSSEISRCLRKSRAS